MTDPDLRAPIGPARLDQIQAPVRERLDQTLQEIRRIVVADFESEAIEGDPGHVTVVLKFASKDAARGWFDSPEYQEIIGLRTDNSTGIAVLTNAAGG